MVLTALTCMKRDMSLIEDVTQVMVVHTAIGLVHWDVK